MLLGIGDRAAIHHPKHRHIETRSMIRLLFSLACVSFLAACGSTQLNEAPEDLGAFSARVIHVYTDKAKQWPLSRSAEPSEWNAPMENAMETRLRRYQGGQEYDVAVSLEGYMLAPPGVPVLVNPKSVAVVNVFVYDVANETFLAKKQQMEIFEDTTGQSAILGSGHSRTKEEQIAGLSLNIADAIEEWIAEQHAENGWFNARAEPAPASE
ncbi:hypothetical protein [Tropicibacter sp. R16_0]|uniref:hypothetical protein n=1 Tax=Tropicibacter sp. R16_0 TaxID=2821102 RepID=UPI00256FDCD4|nr:hypothetical protein [Tropicibacter sp. R16_0]